ncbi:MAG: PAS domain S-box protein [Flavobacteriales bacterium]|nr:PAS domain S-box protein [Flavobacteriales bacterium]
MIFAAETKVLLFGFNSSEDLTLQNVFNKNALLFDIAANEQQCIEMILQNEYCILIVNNPEHHMASIPMAAALKQKHIPILFVLKQTIEKEFYKKCTEIGIADCILKPYNNDLLLLKINHLLQLSNTYKKLQHSRTEIESLKSKLKEQQKRTNFSFEFMFYNSPDLMFILDPAGQILACNEEFINFGQFQSKKIIGKNITKIPFPYTILNTEQSAEEILYKAFNKKEKQSENILLEVRNTTQGTLYYELNFISFDFDFAEKRMIAVLKNITEKKKNEIERLNTNNKLQLIFNTVNSGIMQLDVEGNILFVNRKMASMLGISVEELLNTSYYNYVIDSEKEDAKIKIEEVVCGKVKIRDIERKLQTRNGAEIWCHLKGSLYHNADGSINSILAVFTDITEIKKYEEKLFNERKFFKKILDSFPHGIYIVNKDHDIEYINPMAKEMFGKELSQKCYTYFHKADTPCSFCKNDFVFKGEKVTWYYETPNKEMYLELVDIPLKNEQGEIVSKSEIIQDITEKKNAEKRLRKSEEKYRNLFENIQVGILISSPIGVIEMANLAFCEMLGYTREELLGKIGYDFLLPREAEIILKEKIEKRKKGEKETYETQMIKKNGEVIWVQISASPVFFDSGNFYGIMSFVNDITEIKKATQQVIENEKFVRGIFDSMNSHIAVIDEKGTILITNKAWKNFALENGLTVQHCSEGTNYIAACHNAIKGGDFSAIKTLKGINKLLGKKIKNFQIEYPCHSPTKKRWFLLSANLFHGKESRIVLRHVDITERKELQSHLANTAIQSQEAEKRRIARELHDNIGQKLMAFKLFCNALEPYTIKNNESKNIFTHLNETANDVISVIRNLSHSLVAPEFADFSLFEAVNALIEQANLYSSVKCDIKKIGKEKELTDIEKINIYRVIQEFFNNTIKHSDAEYLKVAFHYKKSTLEIFVVENGKGFNVEEAKMNKNGIGVLNIIHRLESLGCSFDYSSSPTKGTQLYILVELKTE